MENAGLACAIHIRQQLGGIAGRRILALIGPGSNGADGLVIARRLAQWGAAAHCYILRTRPDHDPKMDAARAAGVTIDDAASDPNHSRLTDRLSRCDAVIDAILGAGRYRPPQGNIADAINLVNRRSPVHHQNHRPPLFAIDLPTGLHPNTAAVADPTIIADETLARHQNHRPPLFAIDLPTGLHPDTAAVRHHAHHQNRRPPLFAIDLPTGVHPDTAAVANPTIVADETLALACPKQGIAHFPGAGCAGRISVLDIGILPTVLNAASLTTQPNIGIPPPVADTPRLTTQLDISIPPTVADAARLTNQPDISIPPTVADAPSLTNQPDISIPPAVPDTARLTNQPDIGIPPAVANTARLTTHWMDAALASTLLPPRPPDAHKGTFGHLLIIAGSRHYIGAAVLAAQAAHRAGAGLVTLATPASIYPIVAARLTETIHLPLPESADGTIAPSAARLILERLASDRRGDYNALAVGCGMGQSPAAVAFLRQLLQEITNASTSNAAPGNASTRNSDAGAPADTNASADTNAGAPTDTNAGTPTDTNAGAPTDTNAGTRADADAGIPASTLPLVIDADGLNNLARYPDWPALLRGIPAILTPHPGEMATLTGLAVPDIQSQRPTVAARYAAQWGQTILLKGAHTIIATPTITPNDASLVVTPNTADLAITPNTADLAITPNAADLAITPNAADLAIAPNTASPNTDVSQRILPFANPALAAGGAGDVLTGIIGALLAQGLPPYDAAALGGYLHATAGEQARRMHGAAGVIASDLPPLLPSIMQDLRAALPRAV